MARPNLKDEEMRRFKEYDDCVSEHSLTEQKKNNVVSQNTTNSFFYFVQKDKFIICDLEYCSKSERTFDMSFYDLANNENLLNKLGLYYMQGNYGVKYTYESRAEWFCGYISAFNPNNKESQYKKSISNPIIRLLIQDDELFEQLKSRL